MANNFFRAGGFGTDTITGIICLNGHIGTSENVCTFVKTGSTAGYQVTAGKTFYITGILLSGEFLNSANLGIAIGYSDNDCGINTATARTNPIDVLGRPEQTGTAKGGLSTLTYAASGPCITVINSITIPCTGSASKYLYFRGYSDSALTSGLNITLWGYEA